MDGTQLRPVEAARVLRYLSGFGNEHISEALPGALPVGRNSPQIPPFGLYTEQINGTAFTAPRAENRRSWLYRIRPSACDGEMVPRAHAGLATAPLAGVNTTPNRYRWDPWPIPDGALDFVDGLVTIAVNGNAEERIGIGIHAYAATRSMVDRVFASVDGEFLIVPQEGALRLATEFGVLEVAPGEIALVPRAVKFAVALAGGSARGFVCENYGAHFRLPELGPIGANGLANTRDFLVPVAAFEDRDASVESLTKYGGGLWSTTLDHSPFDVVAWHGNLVPLKYDLAHFMAIDSVTFDHPDPSIFTVLHSPSGLPGIANVDLVCFAPRWRVAEDTFRPPWFHRNIMTEFATMILHQSEAMTSYVPGTCHIFNAMAPHGPEPAVVKREAVAPLVPVRQEGLSVVLETRMPLRTTPRAFAAANRRPDFDRHWHGITKRFSPPAS